MRQRERERLYDVRRILFHMRDCVTNDSECPEKKSVCDVLIKASERDAV
jgi:hypothetical protein